jgi:hypothetical protein
MKTTLLYTLAATSLLMLAACNKAESPAAVQNDVAKAADSAAQKDAKADDKAATQSADAAGDAAVTDAEGNNKVALAKCEALAGDAQAACKDKANAELDMAKAKVKAMKADHS